MKREPQPVFDRRVLDMLDAGAELEQIANNALAEEARLKARIAVLEAVLRGAEALADEWFRISAPLGTIAAAEHLRARLRCGS